MGQMIENQEVFSGVGYNFTPIWPGPMLLFVKEKKGVKFERRVSVCRRSIVGIWGFAVSSILKRSTRSPFLGPTLTKILLFEALYSNTQIGGKG